jgi:ribonuclease D
MEELAAYDDGVPSMEHAPEEAWKKVKTGHIRLDGRGRAILSALAARREIYAQEWNVPRNWLGDDTSLAAMAAAASTSHLHHRLKGKGEFLRGIYEKAIAATKDLPEEEWPEAPHRHYISEVLSAAAAAMDWLAQRAEEIHVDAVVIANRATITAFVDNVNDDTNPLATGWRYEVAGKDIARLFGVD